MPAAAGLRARASGSARTARGARSGAAGAKGLEHRILVTATLCLLAFGAVMVYSASSATSLLQGRGSGSGYLVKYLVYGSLGLVVMQVLARNGVAMVRGLLTPLLVTSFVLVLAVHVPHLGVSVNGARRWIGPPALQFQPSELMKLALVLYAATLLATRPQRVHDLHELAKPLLFVVGAAALLVFSQPDLGTALVIIFTVGALLVAAGIPSRKLAVLCGGIVAGGLLYAIVRPYSRARVTSVLGPWAHASSRGLQAGPGQDANGSGGLLGGGAGR